MARMAVLGGERGHRGLFGGARSRLEWAGFCAFIAIAFLTATMTGFQWFGWVPAGILLVAGWACFTPFSRWGERSYAAVKLETLHTGHRNRKGTSSYLNQTTGNPEWVPAQTHKAIARGVKKAEKKPNFRAADAPLAVGTVRFFDVPTGGGSSIVVFKDSTRKQGAYTVIVETTGMGAGLTDEDGYDAPYLAFGNLLSFLAGQSSLITHVQPISRALPTDATDHLAWMASKIPAGVADVLIDSYAELTEMVQGESEQHRSYYGLLIPESASLARKAARYGGGDDGTGQVILDELSRFAGRANVGGRTGIRALGANHAAALFRSLQDPRFDIDDLEGADLKTCWQSFDGAESPEYIRVNGGPVTRIGFIPKEAFEASARPVQMFQPLVKDVTPSVTRTITIIDHLIPAKAARAKARSDVALDKAGTDKLANAGVVSDGTDEVLLGASAQRLRDLRPGTGYQGLGYGMYLAITADTPQDLMAASDGIDEACSNSGIEQIDWLDGRHDMAFITCLPLVRGLRR